MRSSAPLTASQALGDLATIDYCSLLDDPRLPPDLGVPIQGPRPGYDSCLFGVRTLAFDITVRVGFLLDSGTMSGRLHTRDRDKVPRRGLVVERGHESSDECVRFLRFIDDIWLSAAVLASSRAGSHAGIADWCRVADTAVDVAIRRILAKRVRHYSFADKSIGRLEACDLVPARVVYAKVGVKEGTAVP